MDAIDCVNCGTHVVPMSGDICPACRKPSNVLVKDATVPLTAARVVFVLISYFLGLALSYLICGLLLEFGEPTISKAYALVAPPSDDPELGLKSDDPNVRDRATAWLGKYDHFKSVVLFVVPAIFTTIYFVFWWRWNSPTGSRPVIAGTFLTTIVPFTIGIGPFWFAVIWWMASRPD